jgi:TolB-like protein
VAADVVGYSRHLGEDDLATVRRLSRYKTVLQREAQTLHGEVFNQSGDGFFCEFENAENAVKCAVNVQKSIARLNARRRSDPMWFRMGVALGDIIDDGKAKYGNAINVAARIQGMSDPGGICVTYPVFEEVANKLPYAFDDLGSSTLKNIPRPVHLMRVRWADKAPPAEVTPAAIPRKESEKPVIAILPFEFITPDRDQDYLAEGLVDEVITELSKYKWLSVISRSSSGSYKGRKVDVRLIARELGIRYAVEGSLRKDKDRLRITVQLVSGDTGEQLWSDRFDRAFHEIFDLQDEIVMGIASALEPNVRQAEIQRSRKKPTDSLTAYDYYLQALSHRAAVTAADNQKALELLTKAIDLDPQFAPALAHAASCYSVRKDQGWGPLSPEEIKTALDLAHRAVAADFDHPTALFDSGHCIATLTGDISTGMALIDRSLRINPSSAEAWARSSMVRVYAGDLATAEQHAENAIKLSPLSDRLFLPLCALGFCYLFSSRLGEAVEAGRRALLGQRRPPMGYMILLAAYSHSGDLENATAAASALAEASPTFRYKEWLAQSYFVRQDQRSMMEAAFRAVGVPA